MLPVFVFPVNKDYHTEETNRYVFADVVARETAA